jgi:hydrogenase large subunit
VRKEETPTPPSELVEMSWDPITRIVGSLGIYTKIDFKNRRIAECHSTSSIFRGYSLFMQGKDPRDAHFITSRSTPRHSIREESGLWPLSRSSRTTWSD